MDRLEPTTVVSSATFDERGYLDVGQALSELPAFGIQPSSAANTQAAFGVAQSFVDLYSLGSQRTLVLVNGRRFVSSNTASLTRAQQPVGGPGQQVDLNTIPTKLIERVETVSVGGAPIYGADAIAGTVNIILKKDFQGVDIDAQVGISNQEDAWNYRLRARWRGRISRTDAATLPLLPNLTRATASSVPRARTSRRILGFLAPVNKGPFDTVLTPDEAVPASTFGCSIAGRRILCAGFRTATRRLIGVTNAAGQLLAFQPGSNALKPYNLGTATGNPIFWQGGDGIRLSQFSNLLSANERINVDTLAHFDITDHVNLFGEGWFSDTHATNLIAQPAYNTSLFGSAGTLNGNFVVAANNPFLSAADSALIQNELTAYGLAKPFASPNGNFLDPDWDGHHFYVGRANTDLESGEVSASQQLARGVMGLNGDFSMGGRNFNWEVAANYGSSRNVSAVPAYVFQNVQNALNATLNSTGQIVCAGTPVAAPVSTASSTCAPLNIFGLGSPSLAARQYVTHVATAESLNTQRDLTAFIGGDLFKLPAGEVKGVDRVREPARDREIHPGYLLYRRLRPAQASAVEGEYHTNEVYAETLIPSFAPAQDIPLLASPRIGRRHPARRQLDRRHCRPPGPTD